MNGYKFSIYHTSQSHRIFSDRMVCILILLSLSRCAWNTGTCGFGIVYIYIYSKIVEIFFCLSRASFLNEADIFAVRAVCGWLSADNMHRWEMCGHTMECNDTADILIECCQEIGCEDCLWNDLDCVGWGVKLYCNSIDTSMSVRWIVSINMLKQLCFPFPAHPRYPAIDHVSWQLESGRMLSTRGTMWQEGEGGWLAWSLWQYDVLQSRWSLSKCHIDVVYRFYKQHL